MKHDEPTDNIIEQAALYALGATSDEERAAFVRHLDTGCRVCRAEVAAFDRVTIALLAAAPPVEPPASLGARLMERVRDQSGHGPAGMQVWKNWQPESVDGSGFLKRHDDGEWMPTSAEGVLARQLFVDRALDRVTMLIRMLPGASYPSHRHGGAEECLVLSGDLHVADTIMHQGDFQRMEKGQVHPVQTTEGGCLLLVVSSLQDELLT